MGDSLMCSWYEGRGGRGGRGEDTGCLEDRETKKCQEEVESEGQTRQPQIDGASGSTQLQFDHAGGETGNKREREI